MTILAAIQWVQDQMILVSGINSAPDYPDGGIFPIVITHLSSGEIRPGNPATTYMALDNIVCELHIARSEDMVAAFTTLETLHPLIVAALAADPTLGGTIQTYGNITYSTSNNEWNGNKTLLRAYVLNNCKTIN